MLGGGGSLISEGSMQLGESLANGLAHGDEAVLDLPENTFTSTRSEL